MVAAAEIGGGVAVEDAVVMPGVASEIEDLTRGDHAVEMLNGIQIARALKSRDLAVVALGRVADLVEFAREFFVIDDNQVDATGRQFRNDDLGRWCCSTESHLFADDFAKLVFGELAADFLPCHFAGGRAEMA